MPRFPVAGITKLSELTIDADKDWQAKGISNIKQLAAAMAQGEVVYRGAAVMEKLAVGAVGEFLQSQGAAANPVWAAGGGGLDYPDIYGKKWFLEQFFGATLDSTKWCAKRSGAGYWEVDCCAHLVLTTDHTVANSWAELAFSYFGKKAQVRKFLDPIYKWRMDASIGNSIERSGLRDTDGNYIILYHNPGVDTHVYAYRNNGAAVEQVDLGVATTFYGFGVYNVFEIVFTDATKTTVFKKNGITVATLNGAPSWTFRDCEPYHYIEDLGTSGYALNLDWIYFEQDNET